MKILNVDGFLGRDAEVKVSPKGNKFLSFSMCNNSFVRGAQKSTWYNCSTFDVDKYEKMIPHLKKGKFIVVVGVPDESAYVAKDNSLKVDINLSIDRIEFVNTGKPDDNGAAPQASAHKDTIEVTGAKAFSSTPQPVKESTAAPVYQEPEPEEDSNETGDDLPF